MDKQIVLGDNEIKKKNFKFDYHRNAISIDDEDIVKVSNKVC